VLILFFLKSVFLFIHCSTHLGSYLREALREGSADAVAGLPVPWAQQVGFFFSPHFLFDLLGGLHHSVFCTNNLIYYSKHKMDTLIP
jgi:hypothetical protein